MNHDEIDENIWRVKKMNELILWKVMFYVLLSVMQQIVKKMEEVTRFSMKDCLSLPGLAWKYFNSLGTEQDELIYTYNDRYMRKFLKQIIKRGRVCVFIENFKSNIHDDILKIISEELNVKWTNYDILETYLNWKKKHFKTIEN